MRRVAWATDIHLDFLRPEQRAAFARAVQEATPELLLLAGDIATGPTLEARLLELEAALGRPILFVLGNHDFYRDSIRAVRERMRHLTRSSRHLRWLPEAGVVELTETACVIGHDGWGDARLGDYVGSRVRLNDDLLIEELANLTPERRRTVLEALGDEAAGFLTRTLERCLPQYRHVVVLTHVPPWREATWHEGQPSDDEWLPRFSCKAVGDVLLAAARRHPDVRFTVLCGHTHGAGVARLAPNLEAITGGAEYGAPALQGVLALG